MYFVGFVIFAIVSWIFRDYSDKIFQNIKGLDECLGIQDNATGGQQATGVGACIGKGAVLRISFGSFLFFAAHFVVLLGVTKRTNWRRVLHTGCWPLQLFFWVLLIFLCFLMPNSTFSGYSQFAKICGGVFLVLVVLIFVDWFYMINEYLLVRIDNAYARLALVLGSTLFYLGSIIAIGFLYHVYAPSASCSVNILFITLTLIGAVIYTAISISPWRPQSAGLFTSGAVFIYCTYLCWGALSSQPGSKCVPVNATSLPIQILGFILAIVSVLFTTWDAGSQDKAFIRDIERLEVGEAEEDDLPYNPAFFHAVFALASCYLAMVLTNWSLSDGPNPWQIDRGAFSSWVRISSQWLCAIVYTWTLLAPSILRNRIFD